MVQNKDRTVTFTGHRRIMQMEFSQVRQRISLAIRKAYNNGYRYFMNGMAYGFDLLAAECVAELKKELPDIKLIAVIPYQEQCERWSKVNKILYARVLQQVDEKVVISNEYFRDCFFQRDCYMVSHASYVIAYFNGIPQGGTYYTIKEARKQGIKVENIY